MLIDDVDRSDVDLMIRFWAKERFCPENWLKKTGFWINIWGNIGIWLQTRFSLKLYTWQKLWFWPPIWFGLPEADSPQNLNLFQNLIWAQIGLWQPIGFCMKPDFGPCSDLEPKSGLGAEVRLWAVSPLVPKSDPGPNLKRKSDIKPDQNGCQHQNQIGAMIRAGTRFQPKVGFLAT